MNRFVACISLLSLVVAAPSFAADRNGETKQNPHLESEGRGDISRFLEWLKRSGIADHGIVESNYVTTVQDEETKTAMELSIESGLNFFRTYYDQNEIFVPFEMRIRGDLSSSEGYAPETLVSARAALWRAMGGAFTVDFAGVNYKQLENGQGEFFGIELGSITINEAVSLSKGRNIDLLLKGRVSIGAMDYIPSQELQAYYASFLDSSKWDKTSPHFAKMTGPDLLSVPVSGSVGIRFGSRAVAEVFGSRTVGRSADLNYDDRFEGHSRMEQVTFGSSLRINLRGGLYVRGAVEQNRYDSQVKWHEYDVGTWIFNDKQKNRSATIGVGVRW